jgi:hypothetical protein
MLALSPKKFSYRSMMRRLAALRKPQMHLRRWLKQACCRILPGQ